MSYIDDIKNKIEKEQKELERIQWVQTVKEGDRIAIRSLDNDNEEYVYLNNVSCVNEKEIIINSTIGAAHVFSKDDGRDRYWRERIFPVTEDALLGIRCQEFNGFLNSIDFNFLSIEEIDELEMVIAGYMDNIKNKIEVSCGGGSI